MKLLFIARHHSYFRSYDLALRALAARGHLIHLAVEQDDRIGGRAAVEALTREHPGITTGEVPPRLADRWTGIARRLRLGLDYLRYLDPFYEQAPLLRIRARERTPQLLAAIASPPLIGGARWRRLVARTLHALDAAVPPPDTIVDYLRQQRPDALVITPLVDLGSQQIDYLRAARQLGIPSALAVWSWDHLSSKAYIRESPERVLVWNETQRREAIDLHHLPADRVVVTGAQCFDHWFDRRPSRTREEFCGALGLPADRPFVLWVCSGLIKGSPPELPFVLDWLKQMRASRDPLVASTPVLIRPYPSKDAAWRDIDLSAFGRVAVWGGNPIDATSRADYFDSLYHSGAVAGLNTSAFIEAGIVGRDVLAILPPEYANNQEGTIHFRYLLTPGASLLTISRSFDEHFAQLGEALRRPAGTVDRHRAFLETFVRPNGLEQPSTPVFVQAVEELPTCAVERASDVAWSRWRRKAFSSALRVAGKVAGDSLIRSPKELDPARQARIAAAARGDAGAGHR